MYLEFCEILFWRQYFDPGSLIKWKLKYWCSEYILGTYWKYCFV